MTPFAAVSLCGVAGLADTIPSFSVSGPFLPDVPGLQVPPDCILQPQLRSSSSALPSIFISTTARMFSVSSLLLTCTNNSSLIRLITIAMGNGGGYHILLLPRSHHLSGVLTYSPPLHHSHICCCHTLFIFI